MRVGAGADVILTPPNAEAVAQAEAQLCSTVNALGKLIAPWAYLTTGLSGAFTTIKSKLAVTG